MSSIASSIVGAVDVDADNDVVGIVDADNCRDDSAVVDKGVAKIAPEHCRDGGAVVDAVEPYPRDFTLETDAVVGVTLSSTGKSGGGALLGGKESGEVVDTGERGGPSAGANSGSSSVLLRRISFFALSSSVGSFVLSAGLGAGLRGGGFVVARGSENRSLLLPVLGFSNIFKRSRTDTATPSGA